MVAPADCPVISAEIRDRLKSRTSAPAPDAYGSDGVPGLSPAAIKFWIALLERSEVDKGEAGAMALDAYERCRAAILPKTS